jgi:hypothetical protein
LPARSKNGKQRGGRVQIFTHKDKKYILINGKEFFLIQGYREDQYQRGKLIFMQLMGKINLNYEDLPDANWEIVKTKTPKGNIFTAYVPKFFDYESLERQDRKTFFVGRDKAGSLFLALYVTARLLRLNYTECQIKKVVKIYLDVKGVSLHAFREAEDAGNTGNTAYCLMGIGKGYRNLDEEGFKTLMKPENKRSKG